MLMHCLDSPTFLVGFRVDTLLLSGSTLCLYPQRGSPARSTNLVAAESKFDTKEIDRDATGRYSNANQRTLWVAQSTY